MPDTGWIVATGEGDQLADGGNVISARDIWALIESITSPRARLLGTQFPRRAQYCGSVGWGVLVPDRFSVTRLISTFELHINLEFIDGPPLDQANGNLMAADTIWWKLPPGVTVALIGYW